MVPVTVFLIRFDSQYYKTVRISRASRFKRRNQPDRIDHGFCIGSGSVARRVALGADFDRLGLFDLVALSNAAVLPLD